MSSVATASLGLEASVELETDPLGATVSVGVGSEVPQEMREPVLDDVQRDLVGRPNNAVFGLVQDAHDNLRTYGSRNDYDVASVIDAFGPVEVDRSASAITVSIQWKSDVAAFYEFGTTAHTISGNGVLSFIWEDAPAGIREEFSQARGPGGQFRSGTRVFFQEVEVAGLPEGRWLRDALNDLRFRLRS